MNWVRLSNYFLLFCSIVTVDRILKYYALQEKFNFVFLNCVLEQHAQLNRGVSWGILDGSNSIIFYILSLLVFVVIIVVGVQTVVQYRMDENVVPNIVVLAGALSNFVDRILYGGVVDFISFMFYKRCITTFNIADVAIVVGALLMFYQTYRK